jgi:lipopolysaccharide transport system ATP-binding protein
MAISFLGAAVAGLGPITGDVPGGAIIGVISGGNTALESLAHLAAGLAQPASGSVSAPNPRLIPSHSIDFGDAASLILLHPAGTASALDRARLMSRISEAQRSGAAVLILTHDQDLLMALSDEIWWLLDGRLHQKASPNDVLDAYNRDVARHLPQILPPAGLHPSLRRGDGRARLLAIEALNAAGGAAGVWQSGEMAAVRVRVRFQAPVDDPVVGIMIRTRVGFEVFGTNTELERLRLGPVAADETLQVTFRFRCDLCPQEYTLTAASHDPDGIWHDWLEDAVAIAVADSRYTAGVAYLRAEVTAERTS